MKAAWQWGLLALMATVIIAVGFLGPAGPIVLLFNLPIILAIVWAAWVIVLLRDIRSELRSLRQDRRRGAAHDHEEVR